MSILEAIILGLIQGASEFLPISSSGHLILFPWLVGWDPPGLTFSVFVHIGTMVGTLIYFWKDWWKMIKGGFKWLKTREMNPEFRLLLWLIVGTIPSALVGLLFEDAVDTIFATPLIAAIALIGTAGLLYFSERKGEGGKELEDMTFFDALLIGAAQMLALIPGLSRSGSTISAARLRGVGREDSARYSFLLSTPIIMGAGLVSILRYVTGEVSHSGLPTLIIGFAVSLATSYFVIRWFLDYLKTRSTDVFTIYCLVFACLNILIYFLRG